MAKVLIVDDKQMMRRKLKSIIINEKHEVVGEAENGMEAIQFFRQLKPDIVTMDITMPKMSGLEAAKVILQEFPSARIIMCSAMGQQKIIVEAIEAGAIDFIVKPFDDCRVQEALIRALK